MWNRFVAGNKRPVIIFCCWVAAKRNYIDRSAMKITIAYNDLCITGSNPFNFISPLAAKFYGRFHCFYTSVHG